MNSAKDYAQMTLDELVAEEKKVNSQKIMTALLVGLFVGIAIWAAIHKGSFFPLTLLIFAYLIGSSHSKSLKSIRAEISRREQIA